MSQEMDKLLRGMLGEKTFPFQPSEVVARLEKTPPLDRTRKFTPGTLVVLDSSEERGTPYNFPEGIPMKVVGEIEVPNTDKIPYAKETMLIQLVFRRGEVIEAAVDPAYFKPYQPQ